MDFDQVIPRLGTHSVKWDQMQAIYGVSADDGIAMWVADMDFRPPACIQRSLQSMIDHGIYGYFGNEKPYLDAVQWWMANRHGWQIDTGHIFTTHGLVNGTALCVETFSRPGDHVVLTTPVYHAFARVIAGAGRHVTSCPLVLDDKGQYAMDFAAWDGLMTGKERMFILCSPHNPGGRVWTAEELRGVADFCKRHDLVLVSDEIHHDLVMPGHRHLPMTLAAPDVADRLVMMTATTKTFNIAGAHSGNVIIADAELRKRFAQTMNAWGISANSFGLHMATAAYSAEGAAWVDALCSYLAGNAAVFDAGMRAIPGVTSMPLQATYLAWAGFSGLGMENTEIIRRVQQDAKIAANHGNSFGLGGDGFMRFNIATPRSVVVEAVERMQKAFADLQ